MLPWKHDPHSNMSEQLFLFAVWFKPCKAKQQSAYWLLISRAVVILLPGARLFSRRFTSCQRYVKSSTLCPYAVILQGNVSHHLQLWMHLRWKLLIKQALLAKAPHVTVCKVLPGCESEPGPIQLLDFNKHQYSYVLNRSKNPSKDLKLCRCEDKRQQWSESWQGAEFLSSLIETERVESASGEKHAVIQSRFLCKWENSDQHEMSLESMSVSWPVWFSWVKTCISLALRQD